MFECIDLVAWVELCRMCCCCRCYVYRCYHFAYVDRLSRHYHCACRSMQNAWIFPTWSHGTWNVLSLYALPMGNHRLVSQSPIFPSVHAFHQSADVMLSILWMRKDLLGYIWFEFGKHHHIVETNNNNFFIYSIVSRSTLIHLWHVFAITLERWHMLMVFGLQLFSQ